MNGETQTAVRFSDLMGMIPSITGNVELVYEGEQEGSDFVANHLINEATKTLFLKRFPKIEKLKKPNQTTVYDPIIDWFINADQIELSDEATNKDYQKVLSTLKPLDELLQIYQPELAKDDVNFMKEFILWALVELKQLSKRRTENGSLFNDVFDSYIQSM